MNVLTGRCLHYGEGITFWPLREMVRAGERRPDSPEEIKTLLGGEADATHVADRLSLALSPGNQGRSDAAEIFWAARRLLETLARSRPLLVIFEDLHWAEPTFLDLVESLAVQPGRSPLVLVCDARPELLEQRPAWAAGTERASFHRAHATRRRRSDGAPGIAWLAISPFAVHSSTAPRDGGRQSALP